MPCHKVVTVVALPGIMMRDLGPEIWDIGKMLVPGNSGGDIVAELFDLFANITEESITGPVTDEHDCVNGDFIQVHDHCGPRSDGVGANVLGVKAQPFLSVCF